MKIKGLQYPKCLVMAFVFSVIWLSGCAHQQKSDGKSSAQKVAGNSSGNVHELQRFRIGDPEPPQVTDEELEVIPVEINPKVEQWIAYFQGRGRPHMERYLARSTRYSALMKRILRENGLPEDLIYIALIESGFNWKAHSHAAAVGYWQFIRGTGKRYGLEINSLVDERRDPVLATQAAAEYFKGLYSIFGSWYLAMASYNVGENRVQREIVKNKTRDFWELARKNRLPKETINYVPKFIAAKLIGRNPEKYGFTEIDYQQPLEFELIKLQNPTNIRQMAEHMGIQYEDFKQLNPKFRGEIAPPKGNGVLELRVPLGKSDVALLAASESVVDKVEFIADAGETKTYRIRRGDNLASVARAHKTTVSWLREVNDLSGRRKLRIGQRIQVPDRSRRPTPDKRSLVAKKETTPAAPVVAAVKETAAPANAVAANTAPAAAAPEAVPSTATTEAAADQEVAANNPEITTSEGVYYVVQPGDSLYSIAQEYDSTIKELLKMNKMRKGRVLKVGAKIRVPKDEKLPTDPGVEAQKTEKALESTGDAEGSSGPESSMRVNAGPKVAARAPASVSAPKVSAAKKTHVVRRGESLFNIARKYGVSMTAIQQKNDIRVPSEIGVGRKLVIPEL